MTGMTRTSGDRTSEASPVTGPFISTWSAVSAFGIGRESFSAGLRDRKPVVTALDPDQWSAPATEACLVPGGDPRELLGRKGTRSMDRATGLAVAAVGRLLDDGTGTRIPGVDESTALVLGTSNGSVRSIMSFTRDALTEDKPYHVDPARFPNTVMNCAAGQSAIRHGLRGPNVTIAGGRASALLALNHAQRLQRSGHARSVVCGAVEEFSAERAWLEWHAHTEQGRAPLTGEGSAVLLLESGAPRGGAALAELAAVEVGLPHAESEVTAVLADCVRRALARAGLDADSVWAVAPADLPGTLGTAERQALDEALGGRTPRGLLCTELLGDTGAVSAAFQITALLSAAESDPESAGRAGVVTTVDREGVVGCALLRFPGPEHGRR
ncbi:beta-ketoacyl synthase N-terminal-like domain-containing protein [Streptomyces lincolnensis]|uniref:beta-ketoacyl synthase N-terminal-like domain-containing protein n=1 Tax=Streptomyces lincolnensis TaxID=1915 RepID=UPI0037D881F6